LSSKYKYQCVECGETYAKYKDQCSKCQGNFTLEAMCTDNMITDEDNEIFDAGFYYLDD